MSDFWWIVGDISSTLFPELQSFFFFFKVSTVLIWRQSEWSVLQSFWSNQWATCPFLLFFFSITSSGMAVSPGRIGDRRWSLGCVSVLPLNECKEVFPMDQDRYTLTGKSRASRDLVRSPALCNPGTCVDPSSLFSNVKKYLVCCFKEAQTNSGFFTRQIMSLGKVILVLPVDLILVSESFKIWRGMD